MAPQHFDFNFNLQQFLKDMRDEQNEALLELRKEQEKNHQTLVTKVDNLASTVQNHEARIKKHEDVHRDQRWMIGAVIVGFIAFIFDVINTHLPRLFVKP